MAMPSVKSIVVVLAAGAVLLGCGSTQTKKQADNSAPIADFIAQENAQNNAQQIEPEILAVSAAKRNTKTALASTQASLPVRLIDQLGRPVAYRFTDNPYTQQGGQINAESVQAFIQARRAFKAENFSDAKQQLTTLVEKDQSLAGPYILLGKIAEHQDDSALAYQHYSQALISNDQNVNAYLLKARVERQLGLYNLAQNTYAQALTLWPDFPEAHHNLAIHYDLYLNQPEQAIAHFQAYQFLRSEQQKTDANIDRWLAELSQRSGNKQDFIATKTVVVALPKDVAESDAGQGPKAISDKGA